MRSTNWHSEGGDARAPHPTLATGVTLVTRRVQVRSGHFGVGTLGGNQPF